MSDIRTDREELGRLIYGDTWDRWKEIGCDAEDLMYEYRVIDAILAAGFARQIPPASTIAVPHTPEEIWAFADATCELGFWDKTDLEYGDDGMLHLPSNVNFTPTDGYMPEELRADVGVDW